MAKIFYEYILNRIKRNKNYLQASVGPTGSGKSWSQLSEAEELERMQGREFKIEQVCFSARELMLLINSHSLVKGSCIIWEEAGVSFDSRNAMSVNNRVLSYLLQTCRSLNYIILINLPYFSMLDINARKLMHSLFEIIGINYKTGTCLCKPKLVQTNASSGKTYYHYLRYRDKDSNELHVVKRLRIPKPSDKLIKEYEAKKIKFQRELNTSILRKIESQEHKEQKSLHVITPLSPQQDIIVNLVKQGLNKDEIAKQMNLSPKTILRCYYMIKKKGYSLEM